MWPLHTLDTTHDLENGETGHAHQRPSHALGMRWARSGAVAVVRTTFPGSSAARLVERCAHLCGGAARARGQPLGDEHAALEELCQWV